MRRAKSVADDSVVSVKLIPESGGPTCNLAPFFPGTFAILFNLDVTALVVTKSALRSDGSLTSRLASTRIAANPGKRPTSSQSSRESPVRAQLHLTIKCLQYSPLLEEQSVLCTEALDKHARQPVLLPG